MQSTETDDGADKSSPIAYSGVIDSRVIHDLHTLFRRRVLILEWLFLGLGLLGVALGGWGCTAAIGDEDWSGAGDSALTLAYSGIAFSLGLEMRKGWARRLTGQELNGALHSIGVVVEQLDDRATWDEFQVAWIGESAALLFVSEKPRPPRVLAMDGLPLHSSFFESEETWMRARELIRARVAKVRMVFSRMSVRLSLGLESL